MRVYALLALDNENHVSVRAAYSQADMDDASEVWADLIQDTREQIAAPLTRTVYPVAFSVAVLTVPDSDLPKEPPA